MLWINYQSIPLPFISHLRELIAFIIAEINNLLITMLKLYSNSN